MAHLCGDLDEPEVLGALASVRAKSRRDLLEEEAHAAGRASKRHHEFLVAVTYLHARH